jgi:hypothetical protein
MACPDVTVAAVNVRATPASARATHGRPRRRGGGRRRGPVRGLVHGSRFATADDGGALVAQKVDHHPAGSTVGTRSCASSIDRPPGSAGRRACRASAGIILAGAGAHHRPPGDQVWGVARVGCASAADGDSDSDGVVTRISSA